MFWLFLLTLPKHFTPNPLNCWRIWNITNKSIWSQSQNNGENLARFIFRVNCATKCTNVLKTKTQCNGDDERCHTFLNLHVLYKTGQLHQKLTFEFFNIKPNSWHYIRVLKHYIEKWFSSKFSWLEDLILFWFKVIQECAFPTVIQANNQNVAFFLPYSQDLWQSVKKPHFSERKPKSCKLMLLCCCSHLARHQQKPQFIIVKTPGLI